ncbi:MAG TPA: cyclopropane fatty acyl phospholipid synthase [Candidatus Paceibacterota bacterium]|nr:cyclopropane fatty acyl phospholipid synthase [Candidatus Paceibacterota bacterium]HMP18889.1 cyclopropane fatty acyl phospholipid synthase [Candidatus Paceibacterota bacterium]HMP85050.1 cyclopropane fatty acyl phospholipid synthase [Candidatus Paceibacterota bacterium]
MKEEKFIKDLLEKADIKIGGNRPWDITVTDNRFYKRVLIDRSIGLGESYMEGYWECQSLDEFFNKLLSSNIKNQIKYLINPSIIFTLIKSKIFNRQTKKGALEVGKKHYDIGNDFYEKMLDKRMVYTSGYWKNSSNLDDAQEEKMDLICKKADLKPGMKILDIGCGWGSFVKFATEKYGVKSVGITISKEQLDYAQKNVSGLDCEIRFQDYRDVDEKFDAIVSVEMFEAVGQKNFRKYMEVAHKNLKKGGKFVIQTIGTHDTCFYKYDPWIDRYIFPNGTLPSQTEFVDSIENLFVIEHWENFRHYYDLTLMNWFNNFDKNWHLFKDVYGDKFYRMWKYYLLCCAGSFRSGNIQEWQIVLSKG